MVEAWYGVLVFMMTVYIVLDGRNFGAAVLHLFVARTRAERRQVIAAIGPLWSWHEVWLVAFGGVLFLAFPHLYASAFSGYYLALFLILWCLIFRGVSLEVGGHIDDGMWQSFWDVVFAISGFLLSILFGVALGNVIRGVPIDAEGNFPLTFFTNFETKGNVGLLDWYTIPMAIVCLAFLSAHGATYLTLKTEGVVHDRCEVLMRKLWSLIPVLFIAISAATWIVRPALPLAILDNPIVWMAILAVIWGAFTVANGIREKEEQKTFIGSSLVIAGLLIAGGAAIFPVVLHSTITEEHSLTIYNSAADPRGLRIAAFWWPFAFVFTCAYFWFIARHYYGKVKSSEGR